MVKIVFTNKNIKILIFSLFLVILLLNFNCFGNTLENMNYFPCPSEVKPIVDFWIDIFSKYTTDEGVLHDSKDLTVIYEIINIQDIKDKAKAVEERVDDVRERYSEISLAKALVNASGFLYVGPPRSPYIPIPPKEQKKLRNDLEKMCPYLIYK